MRCAAAISRSSAARPAPTSHIRPTTIATVVFQVLAQRGALTRIFVETVCAFYAERAVAKGSDGAKTGAVTVVQRTSSDLRLHPHLHVLFLDGAYHEQGDALVWEQLGHLQSREVGRVLERAPRRMARYLRRHGALEPAGDADEGDAEDADAECPSALPAESHRTGRAPSCAARRSDTETPRSSAAGGVTSAAEVPGGPHGRAASAARKIASRLEKSPPSHLFGGRSGDVHRAHGPRNAARPKARGSGTPGLTGRSALDLPMRLGSGLSLVGGIATDTSGNIAVGGHFTGTINVGGSNLSSAGGFDVFFARYSSANVHLWSQSYGNSVDQQTTGVAFAPNGNATFVGYFSATMSLGGSTLASANVSVSDAPPWSSREPVRARPQQHERDVVGAW